MISAHGIENRAVAVKGPVYGDGRFVKGKLAFPVVAADIDDFTGVNREIFTVIIRISRTQQNCSRTLRRLVLPLTLSTPDMYTKSCML